VPPRAARPAIAPNVHPACVNTPHVNDNGFEELCHLVTEEDPDTALCGKDVTAIRGIRPGPAARLASRWRAGGDELTSL